MPKKPALPGKIESSDPLTDCAKLIHLLDLDRADQLEKIAESYGVLDKIQSELDSLRHPHRLRDRRAQID